MPSEAMVLGFMAPVLEGNKVGTDGRDLVRRTQHSRRRSTADENCEDWQRLRVFLELAWHTTGYVLTSA
jgi:hypothetical protein